MKNLPPFVGFFADEIRSCEMTRPEMDEHKKLFGPKINFDFEHFKKLEKLEETIINRRIAEGRPEAITYHLDDETIH